MHRTRRNSPLRHGATTTQKLLSPRGAPTRKKCLCHAQSPETPLSPWCTKPAKNFPFPVVHQTCGNSSLPCCTKPTETPLSPWCTKAVLSNTKKLLRAATSIAQWLQLLSSDFLRSCSNPPLSYGVIWAIATTAVGSGTNGLPPPQQQQTCGVSWMIPPERSTTHLMQIGLIPDISVRRRGAWVIRMRPKYIT